jgi:metal-responsive CopG/Arc/MetJ family transcriptional regulator
MKVAVSIPDKIFEEAEQLVKKSKLSRSELYARALNHSSHE